MMVYKVVIVDDDAKVVKVEIPEQCKFLKKNYKK
jgi:hypothetical protein